MTSVPDMDILALFNEEAGTRLAALGDLLLRLESEGATDDLIASMFREAHTLKGAAAVAGLEAVSAQAHDLEELLDNLRQGKATMSEEVVDTMLIGVDRLGAMIRGEAPPTADGGTSSGGDTAGATPGAEDKPSATLEIRPDPAARAAAGAPVETTAAQRQSSIATLRRETVRVAVERLDDLVRLAGESAAAHLRLTSFINERLGGDPQADAEIRALARLLTELHDKTLRARMLSVATMSGALRRAARDVARASGKKVRLEVRGEDTELDRSVHERLTDALLHLVRNAVDHGIETPAEREAAGKAPEGEVIVHAMQLGSRVIVTVTDDGRGIDVDTVRTRAAALGIDTENLSDADVHQLLFKSGFSTKEEVTDFSGRGVGLDVVREALETLRGRIEVDATAGAGSRFRISVPITLALLQGLVVHAGGQRYAIPLHSVTSVLPGNAEEVRAEGERSVRVGQKVVPVSSLAQVIGLGTGGAGPVLVVTGLSRSHAFRVDELEGQRDVVISAVPPMIGPNQFVVGASAEPDGTVMLVLDAEGLVDKAQTTAGAFMADGVDLDTLVATVGGSAPASRSGSNGSAAGANGSNGANGTAGGSNGAASGAAPKSRGRVLIVDDALTVRELQRSILQRAGYDVVTAVDGQDALERLAATERDLVLTDVEMPRMDGLELTRSIRATRNLANLPIVILTSRATDEDRQAGMEAGADAYIIKAAFDEAALLGVVDSLLGKRAG